jgi:glycosyltransferase involved in cell wall biosynthesis
MPKVSVLVPIYNVEKYLRECLDSLINQTLKDIEIICINDGSTDSSPQILEEYKLKDSRIKVINKPNSGYGASMNIGLDNAIGEYIGILESDDFAKNTMFEDLYNLANLHNLDMIKSDFYQYYTDKKQARKAWKFKKKLCDKVLSVKDNPKICTITPSIWSAIYKKSFLDENEIRFLETSGASYQDTSFSFKTFATAKRLMLTAKAYVYYRQDNENSSVKSKGKVYAICDEWNEITRYLNERPELKEIVNQVKLATQFGGYRWNLIRLDEQFKDEFIEVYRQTFQDYFDNNEIQDGFYDKVSKTEFQMLLNGRKAYRKFIDEQTLKNKRAQKRKKLFSIRIGASRLSIVLFGKLITEMG